MRQALVIDDTRQMADSLVQMLSLFDFKGRPAYGSRPALAALNEFIPEIIFLDINMPGVSGFEVLGFIKRDPNLANVPVIVVTSDDQPETLQRAMDAGAAKLIIKPMSVEVLEDVLGQLALI